MRYGRESKVENGELRIENLQCRLQCNPYSSIANGHWLYFSCIRLSFVARSRVESGELKMES